MHILIYKTQEGYYGYGGESAEEGYQQQIHIRHKIPAGGVVVWYPVATGIAFTMFLNVNEQAIHSPPYKNTYQSTGKDVTGVMYSKVNTCKGILGRSPRHSSCR